MRGIYNLLTLKAEGNAPIVEKVFGTFVAIALVSTLVASVGAFVALSYSADKELIRQTFPGILSAWGLAMLLIFVSLWVMLRRAVLPLIEIIRWAQRDVPLEPLELPTHVSEDIQAIYAIVNDSLMRLRETQSRLIESERTSAIARTTQMLAHDVRKPFSMLRAGLSLLSRCTNHESMKAVLARLIPEINRALTSVDGLIADVMEVGSASDQLIQEPASPESLIASALGEAFRIYPKAEISLTYQFSHRHMTYVHLDKVARVFSNLIINAIQAVDSKGKLWFKTREQVDFIEFCIGNSNSYIPPENLPKLFEAFFTSGKRSGTGLGLAIAQKMVTAHGGKIWCEAARCEAYPQGRVEFFFTLPLAQGQINTSTAKLPLHSREIERHLEVAGDEFDDPHVDELERAVLRASQALGRPLKVLLVDDEAIYRNALASLLTKSAALTKSVDFLFAENSDRALKLVTVTTPDLIVTDVDLGRESMNGFDFVRILHGDGRSSALICVHSNRLCNADAQTAIEVGAEVFLPKPMARAQLLKLVLQAGRRAENR